MTNENPVFQYDDNNPTNMPEYMYTQYFEVFESSQLLEFLNGEQNADIATIDNTIFTENKEGYNSGWRNDPSNLTQSVEIWNLLHYSFDDLPTETINNNYEEINVSNGKTDYEFIDLDQSKVGFERIIVKAMENSESVTYTLDDENSNGIFEDITRDGAGISETYTSSKDDGVYDLMTFNPKTENTGTLDMTDLANPFITLNGETINLKPINPSENKIKLASGFLKLTDLPLLESTVSNIAKPSFIFKLMNGDYRKK
jgi:hypothetical protein